MAEEIEKEEIEKPAEGEVEKNPEESTEEKAKKNQNRYSRRVEDLNTKYRTEERRANSLEQENKELKEASVIETEPDPDDYSDNGKLADDKAKWAKQRDDKIREEGRTEGRNENAKNQQTQKQEKVATGYGKQRVYGDKHFKDFYQSEKTVGDILQSHGDHAVEIRDSILESKNSAAIINHLGDDIDKLQELAFMSPRDQAKAIWALDKELEAKPVKNVSSAPDPPRSEKESAPRPAASSGGRHIHKKGETFLERARRLNSR